VNGRPSVDRARALLAGGDAAQAEAMCRELLAAGPDDAGAAELLGDIAMKRLDLDEARARYLECAERCPDDARFHFLAGRVEAMQGRFDAALPRFDRALQLKPGDRDATEWLAMIREWNGEFSEARAALAPFVAARTETAVMAEVQAKLEIRQQRHRDAVAILARHLEGKLDADDRHRLGHLAGSAYEKLGAYDDAFAAHAAANRAAARPYDPADLAGLTNRLRAVFTRERLAALPRPAAPSAVPVFVAGMPRSGTTLVEQIIDAHPSAHGAGEIGDIQRTANTMQADIGSIDPYPECAADLEAEDVERLSARYLEHLAALAPGAQRVVNKSLDNWQTLGLIAVLFPRATIIHCRRDPRDTCVSCFMSNILAQRYPYVKDLRHLGLAYRQYERLMGHWQRELDLEILDVTYEALVDDLESHARRIIEACGLPWDERCLRYHESGRVVKTLSYDQVRRPIYRSSIGRYRHYERHLGPLLEALANDAG
jgi:tetratricopeptide (TPR) repeat protein